MPNWCSNNLRIIASPELSKKILDDIPMFSLGAVIPMPEELATITTGFAKIGDEGYTAWRSVETPNGTELIPIEEKEARELIDKYGHADWYGWCLAHWGTKWDINPEEWVWNEQGQPEISFDTAWSPPMPVIEELARRYPEAAFRLAFSEGGGDFAGAFTLKGDEAIEEVDITPSAHRSYDEAMDEYIDDEEFSSFLEKNNLWIGG